MTRTAEGDRLREQAARHDADARESFERCDTDGFLSQWASGVNGEVARANARIADNGGMGAFERTVLADAETGEVVADARQVQTRFGLRWRIDRTDEWLPYRPARESTLGRRGYREATVRETAPARAEAWAPPGARGLSGATQVRVRIFRTDVTGRERDGWRYAGAPDIGEEE